jgi:polysaccharide biosynthesis transport protein
MLNSMPNNAPAEIQKSRPSVPLRRTASDSERSRSTVNVLDSLRRHWWVAALMFLVVMSCGAYLLWKKARPVYESQSVVYVSPKFPKMLANDSELELPYDSFVQDQIQTVTRYDIIEDAIAKLPYSARHRSGVALPYEIQTLQKELEVKRIGSTYEMSIRLSGPSADGLADIVNTVTDTYIEKTKSEEFYGLDSRLTTLRQEKDRLQKEMDARLAEQAKLMQQLGVATISSVEGTTNPYDSTLQKLRDSLSTARMQRQAAEAQLAAVLKGNSSGGLAVQDSAADEAIASDSGLSGMRSTLNNRRAALMEEMNGLRPDHPIYKKDKEELASIDGVMNDMRRKAGESLEGRLRQDVARTRSLELQLTQELGEKTHTAAAVAPKFQRATGLGPEIDSLQKAYDAINNRIRDLELESNSPGSIHVSSKALTPLGPAKSKLQIYLLALLLLSLGGAIATPVVIDLLDGRIHTSHDVEKILGFHPLGVLLDYREFRKEIAGEYLFRLAAGIDYAVRNSGTRTFLFTSTAHGCGTSMIVRELSEMLRSLDLRTRTIVASALEGMEAAPDDVAWRSRLLLQRRNKTDDIQQTGLSPVEVAWYNKEYRKAHDGPSLNPVEQALHHAGENYDVALIDASPLPISARTEYLARVSDATVLVVKSGVTTKAELDRAAQLLERLEVRGVAVVLNKVGLGRADRDLKRELLMYKQAFPSLRSRPATQDAHKENSTA